MIQADPSGQFVLHVDLGLDKIFVWKFDAEHGKLTPNDPPAISLPPGDGPRHFPFTPAGQWLYVIQEEGSTIVRFDYDPDTGRLIPRQTISTLPPGFAGSNFCSEILVSADGRFVYVGNRLHDTIAVFSVAQYGDLTFVGETATRGNYPRSFNFDPTGQFLYCCNQRGDNVTIVPRRPQNRRPHLHRPLHARRQSVVHRLRRSCSIEVKQQGVISWLPLASPVPLMFVSTTAHFVQQKFKRSTRTPVGQLLRGRPLSIRNSRCRKDGLA